MPADLNELPLDRLFATLVDRDRLDRLVALALEEDLGTVGDVTTEAIVSPSADATQATLPLGVICGQVERLARSIAPSSRAVSSSRSAPSGFATSTENSSPPRRATRSSARTSCSSAIATALRTRSPVE